MQSTPAQSHTARDFGKKALQALPVGELALWATFLTLLVLQG